MKATLLLVLAVLVFAQDSDTLPLLKRPPTKPQKQVETIPAPLPKSQAEIPSPQIKIQVGSIDVYGSRKDRLDEAVLRKTLGTDLDRWLGFGMKGDPAAASLQQKLLEKMKSTFSLFFAEWSVFQHFGSPAIHVTLDVVEVTDVGRRMPFLPEPTGEFQDPEGILLAWSKYEDTAFALMQEGKLIPMEKPECPAYHCPFGHKHPKLKSFEKTFVEGSQKHATRLIEIQAIDKRFEYRAAATYVLAYLKDGKKVVGCMMDRIRDPHDLVRNNALRVLSHIAEFHRNLLIPILPVIEALDFPRVSDRSKALLVLYGLSLSSRDYKKKILENGVPTLIRLLASGQPGHRDPAHAILKAISGKTLPASNLIAWKRWAEGRLLTRQSP